MVKRLFLLCILIVSCAFVRLHGSGTAASQSFTPAWQNIRVSGGGLLEGIHASYSDGTVLTHGDSFGCWVNVTSGTTTRDGTTYSAPAWSMLVTSDSLPPGDVTISNAVSGNVGPTECVAAPSNTNILYLWWQNKVYVSTNRGVNWTWTGLTVNYNPNGAHPSPAWIAVDPANPDTVFLVTPKGTYGPSDASSGTLLKNTTGTTCTSNCWTAIAGLPAPGGAGTNCTSGTGPYCGGIVVFDPTTTSGGATPGIYVQIKGSTGVWHTTNASTFTQVNTGSPPTNAVHLTVDSFGVVWACEGSAGTAGLVFKLSGGSWTSTSIGSTSIISVMQDPHSSATQANNQLIAVDINGQIVISVNNGSTWPSIIGGASISLSSTSPQAGWLNVINQYSSGNLALNVVAAEIDSTGKIWAATGIDVFTTPDPIVSGTPQTTAVWSANDVGVDQLVDNLLVSPPGLGIFAAVWDRGIFANLNPDIFASSQYPNKTNNCSGCQDIAGGWGLDYAAGTPSTLAAIIAGQGGGSAIGKTTDGGNSWSACANVPAAGVSPGGVIALSTSTDWASISGDGSTQVGVISYTTAACGSAWASATFSGSPAHGNFIVTNSGSFNNRQPLAADRVTADVYYAVDLNGVFFKCTGTTLACAPTALTVSGNLDGTISRDRLISVPKLGSTSTAGWVLYLAPASTNHLWISKDGLTTASEVCGSTYNVVYNAGIGAPKPGSNIATIYLWQAEGGTAAAGFYESTDGGVTCTAVNIPSSENLWPYRLVDNPIWMSGDADIYGRIHVGFLGSGPGAYIDAQDACPSVKFDPASVYPTKTLSGTVTLSANSSGKVPITSVAFYYDSTNLIGTQTSGSPISGSPANAYSQSFNTAGLSTGAHTLSLQVVGNGCTETIATIPFTH